MLAAYPKPTWMSSNNSVLPSSSAASHSGTKSSADELSPAYGGPKIGKLEKWPTWRQLPAPIPLAICLIRRRPRGPPVSTAPDVERQQGTGTQKDCGFARGAATASDRKGGQLPRIGHFPRNRRESGTREVRSSSLAQGSCDPRFRRFPRWKYRKPTIHPVSGS